MRTLIAILSLSALCGASSGCATLRKFIGPDLITGVTGDACLLARDTIKNEADRATASAALRNCANVVDGITAPAK